MTTQHKSKGKDLELTILHLFKRYQAKNIFCMRINERKISTGQVVEKSPFDFIVYSNGIVYGFDTKETHQDTINIKTNFKLHQIQAMLQIEANQGHGFFLVYFFNTTQLIKFPAKDVFAAMQKEIKSLKPEDGYKTKLDFLGVL